MNNRHVSEVAALRARIEAECQALQYLSLFSSQANHEIIRLRYKNIDSYHDELKKVVGETEAIKTVVAIYNETVK